MRQSETMAALAVFDVDIPRSLETQSLVYPRWAGNHRVDQHHSYLRHPTNGNPMGTQSFPYRPRLCLQGVFLLRHFPDVGIVGGKVQE